MLIKTKSGKIAGTLLEQNFYKYFDKNKHILVKFDNSLAIDEAIVQYLRREGVKHIYATDNKHKLSYGVSLEVFYQLGQQIHFSGHGLQRYLPLELWTDMTDAVFGEPPY